MNITEQYLISKGFKPTNGYLGSRYMFKIDPELKNSNVIYAYQTNKWFVALTVNNNAISHNIYEQEKLEALIFALVSSN